MKTGIFVVPMIRHPPLVDILFTNVIYNISFASSISEVRVQSTKKCKEYAPQKLGVIQYDVRGSISM